MAKTRNRKKSADARLVQAGAKAAVRRLTCGRVMKSPQMVMEGASVHEVLETMINKNWDHVFIISEDGIPIGRIHAVDVLKLTSRKTVNGNLAWMMATSAKQLVNLPPLQVGLSTPLLKAGALMLTHDLNQLAVVDSDGVLVGFVSHATMAMHLPRFIL
ncbi:MAG: CBS domain-containing protein [Candidatus Poseidoniaceae archaeon]|nr:CBS domain-containing protein [Candidatus Poseidoniaceae archaeon]|tara:strand:- start:171 stop:647 length:477 start_codon:yes stop_codon:yes gene_type:complete